MGDLESLWLVLAVIYLAECVIWIRRDAVAIVAWWAGAPHVWRAGSLLANQAGGFVLANPFPPLGRVVLCQLSPLSVSPDAVFGYTSLSLSLDWRAAQSAEFIPFSRIETVATDGRKLLINGRLFLKVASGYAARQWARQLRRLQKMSAGERTGAIRALMEASLDERALRERVERHRKLEHPIRLLANALWIYLFAAAPVLVWQWGLRPVVGGLAFLLIVQTVTIAALFFRAHRAIYGAGSDEWFTPCLTMVLAAPSALRAHDVLARHLLHDFHPLAAARVLCSPPVFRSFARQVLLDLQYPMLPVCPTREPCPVATEAWFHALSREQVERFLIRAGLTPDELLRAPARHDAECHAYCPRCQAQFVRLDARCANCGNRQLQAFDVAK